MCSAAVVAAAASHVERTLNYRGFRLSSVYVTVEPLAVIHIEAAAMLHPPHLPNELCVMKVYEFSVTYTAILLRAPVLLPQEWILEILL